MLEATFSALQNLLTWQVILAFILMLPVALASGIMPGGGLPFLPVLLAFAYLFDPWVGITLVVGFMGASDITQPVPAILMGVPGARSAQATILDGYPMTRRGEAGRALGISYTATLLGGPFGALVLLLLLPVGRSLLNLMGSAEFFLLSVIGIAAVGVVSSGAMVKGLLSASFGLMLALIGLTPADGIVRASFGLNYLYEGLPLVPVVIGLFAIPEFADLVVADTSLARHGIDTMLRDSRKDVRRGMREAFSHKFLIFRSSLIGVLVAALPGLGSTPAHWIAYSAGRATERGAKETFGHGDPRGILAADSANNSADGGNLIPTLLFAIPGSASAALFLAFLILVGVTPGRPMLTENLDLLVGIVIVLAVSNIVVVPIVLWFAPTIVKFASIRANVVSPIVVAIVTLAAFQSSSRVGDLATLVCFALLGIFMKAYGWPRPPIIIAIVLANPLEKFLNIALAAYGWEMILRPQFILLLVLVVGAVLISLRVQKATGYTGKDLDPTQSESMGAPS